MLIPKDIEGLNQRKYEHEYTAAQVSMDKSLKPQDYFRKLTEIKLGFVRTYGAGKKVLDIGCGSGDFLLESKDTVSSGYGIDYTNKAIEAACSKRNSMSASNLEFIKANVNQVPFKNRTFDLVFSFAALVYVPQLERALQEVARVLKPNGVAILEMGNWLSLNTLVCQAYPELAQNCHVSMSGMKRAVSRAPLTIFAWRAFQILPFWGGKPAWLRPLLHPRWKVFFQKEFRGRMLDERVSNIFFLRPFAYRHFIFCQKEQD